MTCLTQTLSDNLIQAEIQAMLSNSEFVVFLNQSGIDRTILRQIYPEISRADMRFITDAKPGPGLIKCGDKVVPFDCVIPRDNLFHTQLGVKLCSMAGGGVQKIYMMFLREPSQRDRSGSDLFHLRDGFEIEVDFDGNVSCLIAVDVFVDNDFFNQAV